ncbi:MAG: hypothetical protein HC859_02030 [Bacteroidia bacterium]|nr:hypothetical protein [Bacteroidia bacterium]
MRTKGHQEVQTSEQVVRADEGVVVEVCEQRSVRDAGLRRKTILQAKLDKLKSLP